MDIFNNYLKFDFKDDEKRFEQMRIEYANAYSNAY